MIVLTSKCKVDNDIIPGNVVGLTISDRLAALWNNLPVLYRTTVLQEFITYCDRRRGSLPTRMDKLLKESSILNVINQLARNNNHSKGELYNCGSDDTMMMNNIMMGNIKAGTGLYTLKELCIMYIVLTLLVGHGSTYKEVMDGFFYNTDEADPRTTDARMIQDSKDNSASIRLVNLIEAGDIEDTALPERTEDIDTVILALEAIIINNII